MNIVIIDTGFNFSNNNFVNLKSLNGISIKKIDDKIYMNEDYSDNIGHGTIVSNILLEYIKVDVDIFMIKIMNNQTDSIEDDLLIEALRYCEANLRCDLLLISLGTLYSSNVLENIINKISKKGIAIISAFDNEKCVSYPAAYESVIGIDVTKEYKIIDHYAIIKNSIIDIQGADIYHRTKGADGSKIIVKGSSFYCSYITAMIVNLQIPVLNKEACLLALEQNAMMILNTHIPQKQIKIKINNAIVFPINKETNSIAAFEHLAYFNVLGYYDIREKGLVNKKINQVLTYTTNEKYIQDFSKIDWNDDFDTFICGHIGDISKILGYDILDIIAQKCYLHNKLLICFDNTYNYLEKYPQLRLWFPYIDQNHVPQNRFGKLRSPNIPIVGVFGTSSQQGKMTVQLKLREELQKRKIKVKNIGSEPESMLLDFEYSYVFGYESTDLLTSYEMIQILNEAVYDLEKSECEIIIVGSQSGTVPHQLRNMSMIPLKQYAFLLGTQPDSIILCVNGYDEEDYINRTISFFKATVNANVICLVISYLNINKNKLDYKPIEYFINKFSIPVFDLQSLDTNKIIDEITKYYGEEQ